MGGAIYGLEPVGTVLSPLWWFKGHRQTRRIKPNTIRLPVPVLEKHAECGVPGQICTPWVSVPVHGEHAVGKRPGAREARRGWRPGA